MTSLESVSVRAAFSEPFPGVIKYKFFASSGNCTTYAAFFVRRGEGLAADDTSKNVLSGGVSFSCLLKMRQGEASFLGADLEGTSARGREIKQRQRCNVEYNEF